MSQAVQPGVQRYLAKFTGRQKGAIGIFYPCQSFVDVPTGTDHNPNSYTPAEIETAARLQLYDYFEHIQGLQLLALVVRYVPTYIQRDGMRTLMRAAQGRDTFETPEAAQAWIDAVYKPGTNSADTLRSVYGEDPRCEVRPCWCWPGHFDPAGVYFD